MQPMASSTDWRALLKVPGELGAIAFSRSRAVMANEAHDGLLRCPRTRQVGKQLVAAANRLGVRNLAMEALTAV